MILVFRTWDIGMACATQFDIYVTILSLFSESALFLFMRFINCISITILLR